MAVLTTSRTQLPMERAWYARSFGDPTAKLFWHEGVLHMGIVPSNGSTFDEVRRQGLLDRLQTEGYVPECKIADDVDADGFREVFSLGNRGPITYWFEWSSQMLRAAALRLLGLMRELVERGYTLRYPHPWFVIFEGPKPLFMNPGAIAPLSDDLWSTAWEKVRRFFLRPLVLAEAGHGGMARQLLHDIHEGVQFPSEIGIEDWSTIGPNADRRQLSAALRAIEERVESLKLAEPSLRWSRYEADWRYTSTSSWTKKAEVLQAVTKQRHIKTVLDLAGNAGHYPLLAANQGCEVIAADLDEALVTQMWRRAIECNARMSTLVMDFTNPSPGYGVCNNWFPPATQRLRSELVLSFALEHHLVFGRYRLNLEEIARGIRSFSSRYALVEYCPAGKPAAEWRPDAADWYSFEGLTNALSKGFGSVGLLPPTADGRQLILCEVTSNP